MAARLSNVYSGAPGLDLRAMKLLSNFTRSLIGLLVAEHPLLPHPGPLPQGEGRGEGKEVAAISGQHATNITNRTTTKGLYAHKITTLRFRTEISPRPRRHDAGHWPGRCTGSHRPRA